MHKQHTPQPSVASSRASVASISALSRPDLPPPGKLKSNPNAAPSSPTTSPTPANLPTCAPHYPICGGLMLSAGASPVRTFRRWADARDLAARGQASSSTPCALSAPSNRAGWFWKMSPACSHQTMAATSKRSLRRSPNAGIWDTGECLTLVISESPQNAAEYSWSPVWESIPPSACWLTPDQWSAFQARRRRAAPGRTLILRCLQVSPTGQVSTYRAAISSLSPTHGIRWLSGPERLRMMGFAKDWMRPTLQRLGLPVTPSVRRLHAGSRKS